MNQTSSKTEPRRYPILAQLAIDHEIVSKEQMDRALDAITEEAENGKSIPLEDYLIENRIVSRDTLGRLVAATVRHLDKQFGTLVVQYGVASKEQVDSALKAQKMAFTKGSLVLVSDILMEWKLLSVEQRDALMKKLPGMFPSVQAQNGPEASPIPSSGSLSEKHAFHTEKSSGKSDPGTTDQRMSIDIGGQDMVASLVLPGNLEDHPGIEQVKDLINGLGIIFGVLDDSEIEINLEKYNGNPMVFTLARGKAAVLPEHSEIKLYFENDYLNPGRVNDDGDIDFKERGSIPFVRAEDMIAEKRPAVKGVNGIDVFGQRIDVAEVVDQVLLSGTGTRLSDDGLRVYATEDGQPFMGVNGELCVFKELHIPGDVDYATGNIVFDGSIIVKGVIKEGFSVKGGNLTVMEINGGLIDIKGNVDVAGGIMDSTITLGGSLQAMYMSGSRVNSYGDILIRKEIIDSKIRSSGACIGDQLTIISSFVSFKKGIEAKRVGTDVSKPCVLRVGISDHTEKMIKTMRQNLEEKKKQLAERQNKAENLAEEQKVIHREVMQNSVLQDKIEKKVQAFHQEIDRLEKLGNAPERLSELIRIREQCLAAIKRLDDLVAELFSSQDLLTRDILKYQEQCRDLVYDIESLNANIKHVRHLDKTMAANPKAVVRKELFSGTTVTGPNSSVMIRETRKNVTVREVSGSDQSSGYWKMTVESN